MHDTLHLGAPNSVTFFQRPDAETILNMLHFVLWCPPQWLVTLDRAKTTRPPSTAQLMRWVLSIVPKLIMERFSHRYGKDHTVDLQKLFLSRFDVHKFKKSIEKLWLMCGKL